MPVKKSRTASAVTREMIVRYVLEHPYTTSVICAAHFNMNPTPLASRLKGYLDQGYLGRVVQPQRSRDPAYRWYATVDEQLRPLPKDKIVVPPRPEAAPATPPAAEVAPVEAPAQPPAEPVAKPVVEPAPAPAAAAPAEPPPPPAVPSPTQGVVLPPSVPHFQLPSLPSVDFVTPMLDVAETMGRLFAQQFRISAAFHMQQEAGQLAAEVVKGSGQFIKMPLPKAQPKPVETQRKPRALVVGLKPNQAGVISSDYHVFMDLEFFDQGVTLQRVSEVSKNVDAVFEMVDFVSHSHTDHAKLGNLIRVKGGVTSLRAAMEKWYDTL